MAKHIPDSHKLRRLFRAALEQAFTEYVNLYSPSVAEHLSEGVLVEFVHMDKVYRLKDAAGQRLERIPDMLQTSAQPEGPERRMEVDRYIGDFALFMVGFFPSSLRSFGMEAADPMISRVGKLLVQFSRPVDYYIAEGRNAYGRAADTARLFDPQSRDTFRRLSDGFDGYRDVMGRVKRILSDTPQVQDLDASLDSE